MKYRIRNIRHEGNWKCDLDYWEGCYCSKKTRALTFYQENKPRLRDAIRAFNL